MRVWTCTDFQGHWPVGTAAVVVSSSRETAFALLYAELQKQGLTLEQTALIEELDIDVPAALILNNGDY